MTNSPALILWLFLNKCAYQAVEWVYIAPSELVVVLGGKLSRFINDYLLFHRECRYDKYVCSENI